MYIEKPGPEFDGRGVEEKGGFPVNHQVMLLDCDAGAGKTVWNQAPLP